MLQDRRLSITILTIAGALAMIVSACGPMVYGGVKPEQLARIQKGKTTKTDLLRELGAPDQQIDLGSGREEVSYIEAVLSHPQRVRYFQDKLTAEQITEVERFPGWRWRVGTAASRRVTISDPKPGVQEHNRRGYVQGCHCLACVTDMRSYGRRAAQGDPPMQARSRV